MSKEMILTRGKIAIVDDDDYVWLSKYKWSCSCSGYAFRNERGKIIYMHKEIMGNVKTQVDHADGNKTNNQKCNLRQCTPAENIHNSKKRKMSLSRFKGVSKYVNRDGWRSRISPGNKEISLGYFKDEVLAAKAYDIAAKKYYGQFAKLNFPDT